MRKEWILSFSDARQCLIQSLRYPLLSRNTACASAFNLLSFILTWLTLAGVQGTHDNLALTTLYCAFFSMVVVSVGWSFNMQEMHRPASGLLCFLFISILLIWNFTGEGISTVFKEIVSVEPDHAVASARAFTALSNIIGASILMSLWPGFYWLGLSLLLIRQFRTNLKVFKGITQRLLMNLPACAVQVFFFASVNTVLLLVSPLSPLPLLIMPLVAVCNCVYVFLVIVRIENGTAPESVTNQLSRVKLTMRK